MLSHAERRGSPSAGAQQKRLYRYQVYGLVVESEMELPELVLAGNSMPDVQIRFGEVPEAVDDPIIQWSWCTASSSEYILTVKGVARYHVCKGRFITIERRLELPEPVAAPDIRLWLLGSAFGALLHQRGLLPLHVSAVKAPTGVWAFTGESGEGKSTLAGFLKRRFGWELVSDDVSVISPELASPLIYPGPRKLKLWKDALAHLCFSEGEAIRDLSNSEKFQLYLPSESACQVEELHALVLLESTSDDSEPSLQRLRGRAAFKACTDAIYRPHFWSLFKRPEQLIKDLGPLSQSIRVFRFRRPRTLVGLETNLRPLLDLMEKSAADLGP